jgi:Ca2+/Na+ antiporter
MNTKAVLIVVGLAVLVATFFIDSRLTPVVGAALLLGAIVYGWAANRKASDANRRKAERATARQKASHSGARTDA